MVPAFCFLYDYCYFRISKQTCNMKFKPVLTAIALLCICTALSAVPAKRGILRLAQPDGSVLRVRIIGDEFSHIIRTEDGATLKLGPDGFYKYGVIGPNGKLTATEYNAGKEVPGQVLQESRAVPLSFVTRTGRENRQRLAMRAKSALRYEEEAQEEKGDTQDDNGDDIKKVLVLPVQFQDLIFTKQRSDFETLMAKALGYYQDQLEGKYQIAFDVAGIVTVSKGYAYYGEDGDDGLDLRPAEAVQEAVAELDPDVDFSSYDFLYMFYAGGSPGDGGADDDHIWPHRMSDVSIRTQEKTFSSYACSSEMMVSNSTGRLIFTGIGMFCHEFGHELGLKDMYDTDYEQSGGSAEGLWHTTSIMDGGCYNNNSNTPPCLNAIELDQLGIVEPETLAIGDYVLQPVSEQKRFLRMDTDNPGEYFLFECRAATGWDQYMGTLDGLSGSGLLIYHVDRSQNDAGYSQIQDRNLTASQRWIFNEVNNNPSYQCADLLEAYPLATTITEIFYPYYNLDEFSSKSLQPFRFRDGQASPLSLLNIKKSGNNVTFTVAGPIVLDTQGVHQDAFILNWHTDLDAFKDTPAQLVLNTPEGSLTYTVEPYESGKYAFTFENLLPRTKYTYSLSYDVDAEVDSSVSSSFTTKAYNGMPYIYLNDTYRTISGYFTAESLLPLRVYNVPNATSVIWTLDGAPIQCGPDGYYHMRKGGLLKAVVNYEDGSRDIITKQTSYK